DGIDPYPSDVEVDFPISELRRSFELLLGRGDTVRIAGRIMSKRVHGKSAFINIQDSTDKIQLYFRYDVLGEKKYIFFKKMFDIGDFINVSGTLFRTHTGEETVNVDDYTLLAKSVRPLPEKWHGLADEDTKLRYRYLDMLMNPAVKEKFVKRAKMISAMRDFLDSHSFLEVETPILQPLYGGANARPFSTFHNALEMKLFLRIATELYLKRLIIGGLDKVYEIGKNFRNEGIDRMHNPEFTAVEVYQAYANYNNMMELTEKLLKHITEQVTGSLQCSYQSVATDLSHPFERIHFWEAIARWTGEDFSDATRDELLKYLKSQKIEFDNNAPKHTLIDEIFKEMVESNLITPTFITDYPIELSPLAKKKHDEKNTVERFELFWYGMEIANAFTELNDPIDQRQRFEQQMDYRAKGDPEAQVLDEEFITALEHGMPPAGGLGIGIDRMAMILTDSYSIRDIIIFPLLRPK
ncbi:lysine--tRNA ligase, partial [bacterium]|nr:lysine--tRNA ligase [bacterium]